jgi:hypothetical protein
MQMYMLTIYQPEGEAPPPEVLEPIMQELEKLNAELREAGAWVFAGGMHPASTATVLRRSDDEVLMTDGPYVEGKEHIGGFTVVQAADLDAALEWGRRMAKVIGLPIECRPMHWGHC